MAVNLFADIEDTNATPVAAAPARVAGSNLFADLEDVEDQPEADTSSFDWWPAHMEQGATDIGQAIDALQAGLQGTGASSLKSEAYRQEDALNAPYRAYNPYGGGPVGTAPSLTTPEQRQANIEQLRSGAASLEEAMAPNIESAETLRTSVRERDPVQAFIGEGLLDALSTPSAVLSVVGGPVGAVAIADVYERTYAEARDAGLSHEEADAQAWSQAAPESIAVVPAGKLLERIPVLGPLLKERAKNVASKLIQRAPDPALLAGARAAKTVAGESVEEALTGGMQDVMTAYLAGSAESEAQREFNAERAIAPLDELLTTPEFWERRGRDVRAAVIMGGAAGTPGAIVSASRDASRQMEENAARAEQAVTEEFAARQPIVSEPALAAVPDSVVTERPRARWNPETETWEAATPVATPAPDAAPEPVQAVPEAIVEPTPEVAEETPAPAPVGREARNQELGRIHQAKRRAGLTDEAYRETLKRVTGKDSAAKLNAAERMAVADELSRLPAAAPQPAPKAGTVDAALEKMTADLGLDRPLAMAGDAETETVPYDPDNFKEKARTITRSLARANRQQDVDVLNLIDQRKLVIAPNPEAIGRGQRTASTSAAEYDPADGKMYLYTDRANTENVAEILAAAHHESGHAGQFNDREGRPDIFRYMLGNKETENASNRIRKAAEAGNRVAQEAVDLAREAAGEDTSLEGQELIPYLATAVARNRGKTLGSVAGVWQDVNAGLRRFGREKLGMKNLEFDVNELMNATTKFAGEAVATDARGQATDLAPLQMIYNRNSAGFQEAVERGHVYDSADGRQKFVLSDADATISEEQRQKLLAAGKKGIPLSEILDHEVLYEQVPAARDVTVRVLDSIPNHPTAFAQYDGETKSINVTRDTVRLKDPYVASLREAIMHEVQHFVQDDGGYLEEEFYQTRPEHEREIMRYRVADRAAEDASRALLDQTRQIGTALDRTSRARVMDVLFDRDLSDVDKAADIADIIDEAEPELDFEQQLVVDNYRNARQARNEMVPRYNAAMAEANNDYVSNITEREAFRTQYDVDRSQFDIDERGSPEPEMREQTSLQRPSTAGRIDVPSQQGRLTTTSVPLAMAAKQPAAARRQSRIPLVIKGAFSGSQGTSRVINEIVEYARSSPAAARMQAESYMGRYRSALNTLAKRRGVDPRALSEEIVKRIDAIDRDSDSYQQNLEAFQKAVKPFREVGKVLIDMRNAVDALSLDLLKQRAEQAAEGKQLSKSEKKTYTTIMSNLGRYAHRQFAANLRDGTYATTIWEDYLDSQKKGTKLTEAQKANAKRVTNAMKRLVDEIIIPDTEVLEEMDADSVNRLYDTWTSNRNPDALSLDDKIAELEEMRDRINGDRNVLKDQAEAIAMQILGLMSEANPVMQKLGYNVRKVGREDKTGLIASYYRGGKQDRGILKERIEIDPDIRQLMGEIKDPAMRMFTTAAKQAEFVARTKMLMELSNITDPYHVQPPGPSGRPEVKGMKKLEGEAYGPLEGYYVSPELEALVRDTSEQLATFETAVAMAAQRPGVLTNAALSKALDTWGKIAGTAKMLQIVGKPTNFVLNFMGGPRMMLMNGNINPATFTKAWSTASDLIRYARSPEKGGELARRVNAMGVTDSAFIGEINSEQYRELRKVVDEMTGKSPSKVREAIRKAGLTAKESYAMADVVYKIANFYHQADNVLPAYYKAAGVKKTKEEIDREAADIVSRTNITYKRALPIVKALERGGITQFGTYFAEVFRTEVANVRQGLDELKRAQSAPNAKAAAIMRAQAAKRLGGQLLAWTLTAAATKALGAATFGEDDEDKYKRYLLPDYIRNQDFVVAGKDEKGAPVLFEWSRFDPAGPATDIMRRIMNDEVGAAEIADEIFNLYIAPRIGTRLITAVAATLGADERAPGKPITQQLFPNAYEGVLQAGDVVGLSDRATQAWTTVGETFLPGVVDSLKPNAVTPKIEDPFSAVAAIMRYGGAVMYKTDPVKSMKNAGFDYKETITRERKLLGELVDNRPNMDQGTALAKVAGAKQKEMEAFAELRNIYRGMEAAGLSEEDRQKAMEEGLGSNVPKEVWSQIASGDFQPRVVSKDSFDGLKDNALKKLPEEKREAASEKWDEIWNILNGVNDGDE